MKLTPDSWGSELEEYNPCHDPKDGKFTNRQAGRCDPEMIEQRLSIARSLRKLKKAGSSVPRKWARERRIARTMKNVPEWLKGEVASVAKKEGIISVFEPNYEALWGTGMYPGQNPGFSAKAIDQIYMSMPGLAAEGFRNKPVNATARYPPDRRAEVLLKGREMVDKTINHLKRYARIVKRRRHAANS